MERGRANGRSAGAGETAVRRRAAASSGPARCPPRCPTCPCATCSHTGRCRRLQRPGAERQRQPFPSGRSSLRRFDSGEGGSAAAVRWRGTGWERRAGCARASFAREPLASAAGGWSNRQKAGRSRRDAGRHALASVEWGGRRRESAPSAAHAWSRAHECRLIQWHPSLCRARNSDRGLVLCSCWWPAEEVPITSTRLCPRRRRPGGRRRCHACRLSARLLALCRRAYSQPAAFHIYRAAQDAASELHATLAPPLSQLCSSPPS